MSGERNPRPPAASGAGYLCFQPCTQRGDWAALLIVGAAGLPVEFLYSGPLRPTAVQAILYQDRLGPEVRLSLVRSLLRGLRSRLVFVTLAAQEWDSDLAAELSAFPLLRIADGAGEWQSEPTPEAEALRISLEERIGAVEPLGRSRAALAYVAEFETRAAAAKLDG